jgi:hypothetical protein
MSNLDRPLFVWLVFCVGTVWNLQGEKSTVCVSDSEKKETCSEVQAITPPTLCYIPTVWRSLPLSFVSLLQQQRYTFTTVDNCHYYHYYYYRKGS